jgi:hypothetical protein
LIKLKIIENNTQQFLIHLHVLRHLFVLQEKGNFQLIFHYQFPNVFYLFSWFSTITNYRGAPDSKPELLENYLYSLIIENDCSYISEKLFDSFFSGTIPIYVGLDVSKTYIPTDLIIRADRSIRSIKKAISVASRVNYAEWLLKLETWINLRETENFWSEECVFDRLAEQISKYSRSIN